MMELELKDAVSFKRCIDAISILIDEAEFLVGNKGLALKATDPSQISMLDFELAKNAFKKFKASEATKLGLDLSYFSQVMSRAKAGDELSISLNEQGTRLEVVFKGSTKRMFTVHLIDVSAAELPTPKIEFDAEVKLKAELLHEWFKDAALIANHIAIGADAERFYMKADSSKGSVSHEAAKSDKTLLTLNLKKESKVMFPLDYLSNMLKAASSDTEVELSLKSNAPIRISYKVGEASITYFLAPRIESD